MRNYLLDLLSDLSSVEQNPKYHPEGDALFHSLQVFELSLKFTNDPEVWAAALFHDIGKAVDGPTHPQIGAEMLDGIFNPNVCWLVSHHLDLLIAPAKTRQKYAGTKRLNQLSMLRHFDLKGRDPFCEVCSPEWAVDTLLQYYKAIQHQHIE